MQSEKLFKPAKDMSKDEWKSVYYFIAKDVKWKVQSDPLGCWYVAGMHKPTKIMESLALNPAYRDDQKEIDRKKNFVVLCIYNYMYLIGDWLVGIQPAVNTKENT